MEPEVHARAVAEKLECNYENTKDMIKCLKELPALNITSAFSEYSVFFHDLISIMVNNRHFRAISMSE